MELCTRIPPPPIPPWLQDRTKEFRILVANCSSWTRYAESCHKQVPSEFLHTALDASGTGAGVKQWTAVIVTFILVVCIVASVCLVFFLYTTHRMTLSCLDVCRKHVCKSNISNKSKSCIAMSVSEITQLAMEDDDYWVGASPPTIIDELVKRRSKRGRKPCPGALSVSCPSQVHQAGEIMLLPEKLTVDNRQSSYFTASLSERVYCSSHSLPFDSDSQKLATSTLQHSDTFASSFALHEDHYGDPVIHTGQIKAQNRYNSLHKRLEYSSYRTMAEARKVVQRCKKAGISLIHSVQLWHRRSDRWSARHTFVKFRQSINKIRTRRQPAVTTSSSADMFKSTYSSYPSTSSEIWSPQLHTSIDSTRILPGSARGAQNSNTTIYNACRKRRVRRVGLRPATSYRRKP